MFTGLVISTAKIIGVKKSMGEARFTIAPTMPIADYQKGESIAINGVCLTVESFDENSFSVYASAETLSKTTLGAFQINSVVNIERALRLNTRIGGHFVTGHIDAVTSITNINNIASSKKINFAIPAEIAKFIAEKGSISIDGISLTVNDVEKATFSVNIIPETLAKTTAGSWKIGDLVNLETDVIAKYIDRNLHGDGSKINVEFLKENGFM